MCANAPLIGVMLIPLIEVWEVCVHVLVLNAAALFEGIWGRGCAVGITPGIADRGKFVSDRTFNLVHSVNLFPRQLAARDPDVIMNESLGLVCCTAWCLFGCTYAKQLSQSEHVWMLVEIAHLLCISRPCTGVDTHLISGNINALVCISLVHLRAV